MKTYKINFKSEILPLAIIILTGLFSFWAYPELPAKVASHWNFQGNVDGWSSRNFHAIFFPLLILGIYLLFLVIPYIDPRKERYGEFIKVYRLMKNGIILVLAGVFVAATGYNLGWNLNVGAIVASLIGILMIVMGNYFGKLKRNWFVGIRNPWSLSSENVWNKTHRLGGRLFMIWGLLIIIAPWLKMQAGLIVLIAGLISLLVIINLYSYLTFRKEQKNK